MENQVWLHHKYVDKNKTLLSLVQSKGSLSSFTHFKTRQTLFNKSHETAVIVDLNKKLVTFQSGFDSQIAKVLESKGLAEFMNHCHCDDKDLVKYLHFNTNVINKLEFINLFKSSEIEDIEELEKQQLPQMLSKGLSSRPC